MEKKIFNVYFNTEKGVFISENKPQNLVELKPDEVCSYKSSKIDDFYLDTFCDEVPEQIKNFINNYEIKLIVCEYVGCFSPFRNKNYLSQIITIYYE